MKGTTRETNMTEYNNNRAPIAGSMAVWLLVIGVIAALLISYLVFRVGDRSGGNLPTPQAAATARGDNRTASEATRLGGANGDSRADKSVSGNPPSGAGTADASGTTGAPSGTSVPGANNAGGAAGASALPGARGAMGSSGTPGGGAGTPRATGGPGPARGGG